MLERLASLLRHGGRDYRTSLDLIAPSSSAEEANQAKSTFMANMRPMKSHPMNAIIGLTDMALSIDLTQGNVISGYHEKSAIPC